VIDLRSIKPLDVDTVIASVRKTRRLVTADGGWVTGGVGAEIAALVASKAHGALLAPVTRVGLPDVPAPMSRSLESAFYPGATDVVTAVEKVLAYKEGAGGADNS
jgi:pyruvate dehydrogenase E1 component beta subunit